MTRWLVVACAAALTLALVPAGHAERRAVTVSCTIPPDTRTNVTLKIPCASTVDGSIHFSSTGTDHGDLSAGVPGSQLWFEPSAGFQGMASISFTVTDGTTTQSYATTVTVNDSVDHAPRCAGTTVSNGAAARPGTVLPVLGGCADDESDPFTRQVVDQPTTGTVDVGPSRRRDSGAAIPEAMRFHVDSGAGAGPTTWTYKAVETGAHSAQSSTATATVTIPDSATNTAPECNLYPTTGVGSGDENDPIQLQPGQAATLDLRCDDDENDSLATPQAITVPLHGSFHGEVSADPRFATFTYTASLEAQPPADEADPGLPDDFDLRINDAPPAPTTPEHRDPTTIHVLIRNHVATPTPTPTATATTTAQPTATAIVTATPTASPTATPPPVITKAQVQAVLGTEVTPDVVDAINTAVKAALSGGSPTVTVTVGPYDVQVTIDLQLLLTTTSKRAAIAKKKTTIVGKATLNLAKGKTGKLKVKLTGKGKSQLKKKGKLRVTAKLKLTNAATGASATKSKTVNLKYKKKHRR